MQTGWLTEKRNGNKQTVHIINIVQKANKDI